MRTTVELPPELLRAAKARSAESGESLKALLMRAIAGELELHAVRRAQKSAVTLPLFGRASGPRVRLTSADLERALAGADAARVPEGAPVINEQPSRRRRRG